jgi:hypothetical protein
VALANGKVLVAGGFDRNNDFVAGSELYDPASGNWQPKGAMQSPRQEATATLLTSGKVLAAGGSSSSSFLSSAELYDPVAGAWTFTGSMHELRWEAGGVLLPNGKVLVAGGAADISFTPGRTAELYDPATGTWSVTGPMSHERRTFTLTLLPNGKVLAAGGFDTNGIPITLAELYDPATQLWTPTGSLQSPRFAHTATLLPDGRVLVAGGSGATPLQSGVTPPDPVLATAELYDPATGAWTPTGSMGQPREAHKAVLLTNGKVLVAGGSSFFGTVFPTSAEMYDPAMGKWLPTLPLASGRRDHALSLLPGGKVLVAGGLNTSDTGPTAELFDPASAVAAPAFLSQSKLPNGSLQITFRNTPGLSFTALTATDLVLSLENWAGAGAALETSPGHYQFTNITTTSAQRFYGIRSP